MRGTSQSNHLIMITLGSGFLTKYFVASGALAFDGKGWIWERPLVWLGLLKPELFAVVIKTLTLSPRKGNLRWWKPWTCVSLISGGAVNKVGLTNKGMDHWERHIAPRINFIKYHIVGSILGNQEELVELAKRFNHYALVALEVNYSCPNTGHSIPYAEAVAESVKAVAKASRHPIIVKVSVDQDYVAIAKALEGIVAAISINSVPYSTAFPDGPRTPLWKLEQKVGGGGGGVSGRPAQKLNWKAVQELAQQTSVPVIAPSIMEYEDMRRVKRMGAEAVSFGTIHLPTFPLWNPLNWFSIVLNPLKPTRFVRREQSEQK